MFWHQEESAVSAGRQQGRRLLRDSKQGSDEEGGHSTEEKLGEDFITDIVLALEELGGLALT